MELQEVFKESFYGGIFDGILLAFKHLWPYLLAAIILKIGLNLLAKKINAKKKARAAEKAAKKEVEELIAEREKAEKIKSNT